KKKTTIYMDYAAATPVSDAVIRSMQPFWQDAFYNPSSLYQGGTLAHTAVENSRTTIAKNLGTQGKNIIFTAGGTESNNVALWGIVRAWQKKHPRKKPHVIISAIEHAAVRDTCLYMEKEKMITLTMLPVRPDGIVDMQELKKSLAAETALVAIGFANSEIGTLQPIEDILKTIRHFKKNTHGDRNFQYPVFHSDAISAFAHCDIKPERMNIDSMSISAAKIYGPKGIALLYVRSGVDIEPFIIGGGQERQLRSGTENVPLIVGFAQAIVDVIEKREDEGERLRNLQDYFLEKLESVRIVIKEKFPTLAEPIRLNGSSALRLPNNINISLEQLSSEQLVLELDARGVMVASRSACSEQDSEGSYVLQALSSSYDSRNGSLRFSFGRETTKKDIDMACDIFQQVLVKLHTTRENFL
ncbi:MAG: cysteine desulfurase, partial [Candidatus Pacebacteria bacterium]|nr:cysteine desulfurase [Candidatus Paceibacterota bacterium]